MSPATRAFLWTPSTGMKDLGMLPGDRESEAVHINDAGDVVGWSSGPDGSRAVLWSARGAIKDLGTLPGGKYDRARAINAHGDVVGLSATAHAMRAFLWTRTGGMQDLNSLIPAASGFVVTEAVAINDQGLIVALGHDDDHGGSPAP
jgi:probable HAF family extracellular repeat protein